MFQVSDEKEQSVAAPSFKEVFLVIFLIEKKLLSKDLGGFFEKKLFLK